MILGETEELLYGVLSNSKYNKHNKTDNNSWARKTINFSNNGMGINSYQNSNNYNNFLKTTKY